MVVLKGAIILFENFEALKRSTLGKAAKTIVVAAAADLSSLEAINEAVKELNVKYKLVGDSKKIMEIAGQIGFDIDESAIIHTNSEEDAARASIQLIRDGEAEVLMKGNLQTATLLKAVLNKENGISSGGVLSHLAVLESPAYSRLMFITDGGMNIAPDLTQKKAILENSVQFMRLMGYDCPNVAVLAAAESVSEKMPETIDAAELVNMRKNAEIVGCVVEGPLSFDLAINKESAVIKGFESKVSGEVDLFLVPNIATGNIMSKALIYLGGAKMAGCILGAKVPIVLVSRGASVEEKLLSILLTL